MHLVNKTACSYSYVLAQEQHEFVRHTLKLIIGVFKLIPDFKSSKLDHSKDYNINPKNYTTSRISTFHFINFNVLNYHQRINYTF